MSRATAILLETLDELDPNGSNAADEEARRRSVLGTPAKVARDGCPDPTEHSGALLAGRAVSRDTATLLAVVDSIEPGQPANDEVATEHRCELALVAPGPDADDRATVEITTWIDALALALAAGLRVGATGLDRVATGPLSPAHSTAIGIGDHHQIAPGDTDAVLTVDDVAALLKLGRNAIYESVARDEIPHRRIGKQIRFSRAAVMSWLSSWSSRDAKERQR